MLYDYKCPDCGNHDVIDHHHTQLGSEFKCTKCDHPLQRFFSKAPAHVGPKVKPSSAVVWETSSAKRARWRRNNK